ncbi:hypothetical protein, partial [Bradyrhizobium sp. NBAIM08]|uniref:hypothetical protein n=1 Tax=Bradyrhizobium sp. NBAIM08 TaxID=2793815 RepID=UPI001CD56621
SNLSALLETLKSIKADDSHTKHAAKIALRETLRDPQAWLKLSSRKPDDAVVFGYLVEVCGGLPNEHSADFITKNLTEIAKNQAQLPALIEHAVRYGDVAPTVFAFIQKHEPNNAGLQALMFQGYQRGLQQKNTRLSSDDLAYA